MHFHLDEQQQLLADTLRRFLAEQYPLEHRNRIAYAPPYHDRAKWRELCELGILHAMIAPDKGGFGGTGTDITTVFEETGRALCPEPFLPSLLALSVLPPDATAIAAILEGQTLAAVGLPDDHGGGEARDAGASGWKVTGRWPVVYGAHTAQHLYLAATHDGIVGLFEVQPADVQIVPFGMVDGGGAAQVLADGANAKCVMADAEPVLQYAETAGLVALCAEALGIMSVISDLTAEYLATRKQFGRPIGSFQVLQHRMVDLMIEIEQARSITILAGASLGQSDGMRHASMAKNLIGRAGKLVAEEAIQMHGGIGMTWEFALSHYAKRLIMIDHQLGDTDVHLARVMHSA